MAKQQSLPRQESQAFQRPQLLTPSTVSEVRMFLGGSDGCPAANPAEVEEFGAIKAAKLAEVHMFMEGHCAVKGEGGWR